MRINCANEKRGVGAVRTFGALHIRRNFARRPPLGGVPPAPASLRAAVWVWLPAKGKGESQQALKSAIRLLAALYSVSFNMPFFPRCPWRKYHHSQHGILASWGIPGCRLIDEQ